MLYITPGYVQRLSRINFTVGKMENVKATTFTRFEQVGDRSPPLNTVRL